MRKNDFQNEVLNRLQEVNDNIIISSAAKTTDKQREALREYINISKSLSKILNTVESKLGTMKHDTYIDGVRQDALLVYIINQTVAINKKYPKYQNETTKIIHELNLDKK